MKKTIFNDIVILAGGIGERLWPASTPKRPKQFMSFSDGISFLQKALLKALALSPDGKIIIITRKSLLSAMSENVVELLSALTSEQQKKIKEDLIILTEPSPRHTCAPLVLVCKMLKMSDQKDHNILVLASDHVIEPVESFVSDCEKASETAKKGNFVCFAIPPTYPETGYGYIKTGSPIENDDTIRKIDSFKEKPDLETAKSYFKTGEYAWNSGMFAFTSDFFLNEVNTCTPEVYKAFDHLQNDIPLLKTPNGINYISDWRSMDSCYEKCPSIAVDNAVAEKTSKAAAVKTSFNWDDVGSWDAFSKYFTQNSASTVEVKSENNFVYSDIPVSLCNVEDLIVVIKDGRALIMKKGSSENMREVVKKSKEI